jgi:hypothetical protein
MTDIPTRNETETRRTEDLSGRDTWLFAPLLLVLIALPLAMVTVMSAGLWFAAHRLDLSLTQPAPTTFAARWPDKALPTVTLGQRG